MSLDHPAWPMSNLLGHQVAHAGKQWTLVNAMKITDGAWLYQLFDGQELCKVYAEGTLPHVSEEVAIRALESEFDVEYLALEESGRQVGEAMARAWTRNYRRGSKQDVHKRRAT
jgi:hypothetical protein